MFRSNREKKLVQTRHSATEEARRVLAAIENCEEVDLTKLQAIVEEIKDCHKNTCDRRRCFSCGEKFLPEEPHAEILISYCKNPDGKLIVAGYYEQHYLTPCKACYEKLGLEKHWEEFKPTPINYIDQATEIAKELAKRKPKDEKIIEAKDERTNN